MYVVRIRETPAVGGAPALQTLTKNSRSFHEHPRRFRKSVQPWVMVIRFSKKVKWLARPLYPLDCKISSREVKRRAQTSLSKFWGDGRIKLAVASAARGLSTPLEARPPRFQTSLPAHPSAENVRPDTSQRKHQHLPQLPPASDCLKNVRAAASQGKSQPLHNETNTNRRGTTREARKLN